MDLDPFLAQLRCDLAAATQPGHEEARTAAIHLAAALEPAARLVLLDVLVSAAEELSVAGGIAVEVRLRGREVDLVAHAPPVEDDAPPLSAAEQDGSTARVSLRLPESLKSKAESRANAEGSSLNTWLVRAVAVAVDGPAPRRGHGPGTRITGWARS